MSCCKSGLPEKQYQISDQVPVVMYFKYQIQLYSVFLLLRGQAEVANTSSLSQNYRLTPPNLPLLRGGAVGGEVCSLVSILRIGMRLAPVRQLKVL
jgi:hypothetical protein